MRVAELQDNKVKKFECAVLHLVAVESTHPVGIYRRRNL